MNPSVLIWLLAVATALLPLACDEDLEMDASPCPKTLTFDGNGRDWEGMPMAYLADDQVSVAVCNDQKNLYLLLLSTDYRLGERLLHPGTSVWIAEGGDKQKTRGLFLQDGELESDKGLLAAPRRAGDAAGGSPGSTGPAHQFLPRRMSLGLIAGAERRPLPTHPEQGPAVAAGYFRDIFSCELRIPLQKSDALPALDPTAAQVGFTFRLPEAQAPRRRDPGRRRGGPGHHGVDAAAPPGGGLAPPGAAADEPRKRQHAPDLVDREVWLTIHLAKTVAP